MIESEGCREGSEDVILRSERDESVLPKRKIED